MSCCTWPFPGTLWLEITFLTAELREICEKRDEAAASMGYDAARELADRLADIDAVDTVEELSQLLGPMIGQSSATEKFVLLQTGFRVCLGSGHPRDAGAQQPIDWSKTSRLKILGIEKIDE
jgi:hypothetical protein